MWNTQTNEVIFNKFSFENLQKVFERSIHNQNDLKFLIIEDISSYNEKLFEIFTTIIKITIALYV